MGMKKVVVKSYLCIKNINMRRNGRYLWTVVLWDDNENYMVAMLKRFIKDA